MSQQVQRYAAALLGAVVVATWAAAGLEAALVSLGAAACCYLAAAGLQRRRLADLARLLSADLVRVGGAASHPRPRPSPAARHSSRPTARRASPARPPRTKRPAPVPYLTDPVSEPSWAQAGPYGW